MLCQPTGTLTSTNSNSFSAKVFVVHVGSFSPVTRADALTSGGRSGDGAVRDTVLAELSNGAIAFVSAALGAAAGLLPNVLN